jgi:hypothetical protein
LQALEKFKPLAEYMPINNQLSNPFFVSLSAATAVAD